jgi:phosphate transport system permease protein
MSSHQLQRAKLRNDLIAKWVITCIGVATIFSVLAIVVVVFLEIIPLFSGSQLKVNSHITTGRDVVLSSQGPWFEKAWSLDRSGEVSVHDLKTEKVEQQFKLRPQANSNIVRVHTGLDNISTLAWDDGSVTRVNLGFKPSFDQDSRRTILLRTATPITHTYRSPEPLVHALSRENEEGSLVFMGLTEQGKVIGQSITREEDFLGNINEEVSPLVLPVEGVSHIAANALGTTLFSVTQRGELSFWGVAFGLKRKGSLQLNLE